MSTSLRIEVLLSAIDRATKPFRNITKGASGAAEAVRKSKAALAALEKTSGDISGYARLRAQLRSTSSQLAEHTAQVAANRASLETQRTAHHALAGEVKASRAAFQQQAAQFAALKKPSAAATANYQAQKAALAELEARYSTSAAALRKQRDALTSAEGNVRRFTLRNSELGGKLDAVRQRLEMSGISTDKLGRRQREMRAEVQRANQAIAQQIQRADALARSQARLQQASSKMTRGGMLASAHGAGFYAAGSVASDRLTQTMQPGVDLQAQMRDISITGGFNKGQEAALTSQIRRDAVLYAQTTDTIGRGLGVLVANGISDAKALGGYSGMLAKKSVASGAEVEDLSNTIVSLTQNLDIAAKDVSGAIDSLAYSGKQGSFELRDMAKWMPQLSPMMAALGVKGRGAVDELGAALQVARLGAGTSDEAANNLRNYLAKIISPDTLQNFDKAGIDLKRRLLELQAKGVSPLQGSLRVITEYMGKKGPEATKKLREALKLKDNEQRQQALDQLAEAYALGDLFRDQQAMSFIRPALMNDAKMQTIRQDAAGADGVLDQDFAKRMETSQKRMDLLRIKLNELKLKGFDLMAPSLNAWSDRLGTAVDWLTRFASAHPKMAALLFKSAGAFAFLAVAAGVLLIPLGLLASTIGHTISVIAALQRMAAGAQIAKLGSTFRAAASGARMLLPVLGGISAPVLLIGAAVATVALLVWKYWGPIQAFLSGMGEGLRGTLLPVWEQLQAAMAPLQPVIDAVGSVLAVVWGTLKEMVRPFQATNAQLQAATGYGRTFGAVLGVVIGVPLRMIVGLLGIFARVLRFAFEWSPVGMVVRNWSSILPRIQAIVSGIGTYIRGAWSVITGIFSGDAGRIRSGLQTMWTGINTVLAGWPARMLQLGQNVVQGLINGIRSKATAVGTAMGNIAGATVASVKQSLGIRSPSRVFAELGGFTMQGFTEGLQAGARGPLGALDALGKRLRAGGAGLALGALAGPAMAGMDALPPQALRAQPYGNPGEAIAAPQGDAGPRFDTRPPLLAAGAPGVASRARGNTYNITIHAGGAGTADDIKRAVQDAIEELEHKRGVRGRSAMSDYDE